MAEKDFEKQRRHPRLSIHELSYSKRNAQVSFQIYPLQQRFQGKLSSISPGGAFVTTPNVLNKGTFVFLHFHFGGRRIQCLGQVIYTKRGKNPDTVVGFGISFTRIIREDFRAIRSAIQNCQVGPTYEGLIRNLV